MFLRKDIHISIFYNFQYRDSAAIWKTSSWSTRILYIQSRGCWWNGDAKNLTHHSACRYRTLLRYPKIIFLTSNISNNFSQMSVLNTPELARWYYVYYTTLSREFQGFRVWGKFVFRTLELTNTRINLANHVKVGQFLTNRTMSNRADLRERTKTMRSHGDRRGKIADFRDSFERINWLYLHSKCVIKTKTHFEWLLWH